MKARTTVENEKEIKERENSTSEKEQSHNYTTASPEKENTATISERINSEIQKKIFQIFEYVRTKKIAQRQSLKKINETKAIKTKIDEVNENLGKILEQIGSQSLSGLNHLIFASAAYLSQPKKDIDKNDVQTKPKISRWKTRLQGNIKNHKRLKYNRRVSERQQKLKSKNKSKLDKEKTKNGRQ